MKLAVIGTGYVGLVSGVGLSALGVHVVCIDRDAAKIAGLRAGKSPIFEPGLDDLLTEQIAAGHLTFAEGIAEGIQGADAIMIAVGTPPDPLSGLPDLTALFAVVETLKGCVLPEQVIIIKSTVPMGTNARVRQILPQNSVVSNPEFLREGHAIADFMNPDRIVVGVHDEAISVLETLYAPLTKQGFPLVVTSPESAEMIKYAANSLLATKVAFINEMADICDCVGANVLDVASAMGMDPRIGKEFLKPGPGIGGSCFPKDTLALSSLARTLGLTSHIVEAVIQSNDAHMQRMAIKINRALDGGLKGRVIAALGLTFKAATDDMRESASLTILPALVSAGATVVAYDPEGMDEAKKLMPQITYASSIKDALVGAHAAVILTDWQEFKTLPPETFAHKTVVDLRNIYNAAIMEKAGINYIGLGV
jgi:UDPglucose 6-dehydrogenase